MIPCCVDNAEFAFSEPARRAVRTELGLSDSAPLLCYSGGLSFWQRIADVLRLCRDLARQRADCRFLFLTRQEAELAKLAHQEGLPPDRFVVRGCAHEEIPHYLSAADAGIILRDDTFVNNTASPIKIGEYLSCGLPVILTKGIGTLTEMVRREDVGLVLDEGQPWASQVQAMLDRPDFADLRRRAIAVANRRLSFDAYLAEYGKLFAVPGA